MALWGGEKCLPETKRPLWISRHRRDDNIKMGYEEERREGCVGLMWLRIGSGEGTMNHAIIYVSTAYSLKHRLHVST